MEAKTSNQGEDPINFLRGKEPGQTSGAGMWHFTSKNQQQAKH